MKKIISLLAVVGLVGLFSVKAFAGIKEGYLLNDTGRYAEAEAEFRLTLANSTGLEASFAQLLIGCMLENQKKYDQALVELAKVKTITDAANMTSQADYHSGVCLEAQGKLTEAQAVYKKVLLTKNAWLPTVISALNRIDFVAMTQDAADALLIKAYRMITNKQAKDDKGNYIYVDYLSTLVSNMSQKAQANFVK